VKVIDVIVAPAGAPVTVTEVVKLELSVPLAELEIGVVDDEPDGIPNTAVWLGQSVTSGPALAVGRPIIVTTLVAVAFGQPPAPKTVYVIVEVPAETPVITPVDASIVATPVEPEDHVPPAEPLLVNVVLAPTQAVCVPANTPADAPGNTVTNT
jgi:hypothetical protein